MSDDVLLDVADLHVTVPGSTTPILDGLDLRLRPGERVALVGPSGAGKTTLLRALNGSHPIRSGQVRLNGQALNARSARQLRQWRSDMALIPQKHDLVDRLKVSHNVMAGALGRWSSWRALRFLFWPRPEELEEAERALVQVGLADRLRQSTATLSGGQQQRVAIARALVQQSRLILADEPVASLDPDMARQVLDLLCRLAESNGVALICTLHQPELARAYFPRILRMHEGRLLEGDATGQTRAGTQAPPEAVPLFKT